jgi:hypothetical protein
MDYRVGGRQVETEAVRFQANQEKRHFAALETPHRRDPIGRVAGSSGEETATRRTVLSQ